MSNNIEKKLIKYIQTFEPWTNVYGLARSILALATFITLLFNPSSVLFRPAVGIEQYPVCSGNFSIFCLVPSDYIYLEIVKYFCMFILFLVIIGWRPRLTGILHYWIMYSIQNSVLIVDGGEQIGTVLTLLLIPITLVDNRTWHWSVIKKSDSNNDKIISKIIFLCYWYAIRFQMAFLYASAAIIRLKNPEWADGTALYYFFNDPMIGTPDFIYKIIEPIITSSLVVIPTWLTTITELLLFCAFFSNKKYWKIFLFIGISLHITIAIFLGLWSFSLIMISGLILYLHPVEKQFKFNKIKILLNNSKQLIGGKK